MTVDQFNAIEKYFMALIKDDNSAEDYMLLKQLRDDVLWSIERMQEK